jgi:exonuclease VII large subunit
MARGYAVVTDRNTGTLIADPTQVSVGEEIDIRIHRGKIGASVDTIYDHQDSSQEDEK